MRVLAGAAATAAGLAGCGAPRPTFGGGPTDLLFATYNWGGAGQILLSDGAAAWTRGLRGVRLTTVAAQTDPAALTALLESGNGPDVLWAQDYGALVEAGALLPLDDYIRRDRVETSGWPAGKMAMLRTPGGTFGLPAFTGAMCYALRLDAWAGAGVRAPGPDWTAADLAQAAARLTSDHGGQHRYGTTLQWYTTWLGDNAWPFAGFGGAQMAPDGASSRLSSAGSAAAGQWLYNLLWAGQACTADQAWSGAGLPNGTAAMALAAPWTVAADAAAYGAFEWDYHPFPVFPGGQSSYANSDFFAISARTPSPEAAWSLLRWLAGGADWQRFVMKTGLLPPASVNLWDEWEAQVRAVAPAMAARSLQWFGDAARAGYGHPQAYYRYADTTIAGVAAGFVRQLWNRQLTAVPGAFQAADQAINAALDAAAAQATAAGAAASAVRQALAGPPARPLPAPADAAPAPTGSGALGGASADGYTLTGNGAGLGGTADAGTLAAVTALELDASFTCRLTALRSGSGPYLAGGAQAALMARASLAPDAPFVAVGVTGDGGVQVAVRPDAGLPAQSWSGAGTPQGGLLPPAQVTRANRAAAPDYLLRPIWLRLQRAAGRWTCLISTDGQRWQQAGPQLRAEIGGCWIGLFATAANSSAGFTAGQTMAADFNQLSFRPGPPVQIGTA